MHKYLIAVLLLLLGVLAILGGWWLSRQPRVTPPAAGTPSPAASPSPTAVPSRAAVTPASAYRLAGVAVGDQGSFAVFEDPSGATALYNLGDDVPGLGKLTKVERRRAVITGPSGEIEFRVQPAPTPTRGKPRRIAPAAPPRSRPRAATPVPVRPPAPARTAGESRSSTAKGRSAS